MRIRKSKIDISLILLFSIVTIIAISVPTASAAENTASNNQESYLDNPPDYELIATVLSVADGDTIWIRIENITAELDPEGGVREKNTESVRFGGGVDAPETWTDPPENGAFEAKEFIENLIPPDTTIYIDLDNLAEDPEGRPYRGQYSRLISVIYTRIEGRWININAELLRWGQKEFPSNNWLEYFYIDSEFNAKDWLESDYPYVRDFNAVRKPEITILPEENSASPGEKVNFKVFVKNMGNVEDRYILTANDNRSWNPTLSDNSIEHIGPNAIKSVILTVSIPDNTEDNSRDKITLTATSLENRKVKSSKVCTAYVPLTKRQLSVNIIPSEGGSITLDPSKDLYVEGTKITATANPADRYRFNHWSSDASGNSKSVEIIMDTDKNITANFSEIKEETPWFLISAGIMVLIVVGAVIFAFIRR